MLNGYDEPLHKTARLKPMESSGRDLDEDIVDAAIMTILKQCDAPDRYVLGADELVDFRKPPPASDREGPLGDLSAVPELFRRHWMIIALSAGVFVSLVQVMPTI